MSEKLPSAGCDIQRDAVGTHVWRMADGSDALHDDCVGPSQYKKSQGVPIRVWGLLANGKLHTHVLDQGEVLDRYAYQEIVEDYFPSGWVPALI